uniref:Sensory neuron membrane protein n=1 Tax=Tyrophagus putrescentiae TaxID=59818 RepID=A0A3S6QCU3_TYRPU|nr:sensory neuron membrane protein [Tyrophagus putrescentiae]
MGKVIPIVIAVIGVILAVVGAVVLWGVLPTAINNKVADEMYIRDDVKNDAYKRFKDLPIPLRWSMRFFHVTNPEKFDGKSLNSLKFEERGPYVYDEIRGKLNLTFGKDQNTVEFYDNKTYVFNPTLSGKGLSPNDTVTQGPYVYDEIRGKLNLTFGKDQNTVEFYDNKTYVFNPTLSGKGLSPNDTVTIVHFGLSAREDMIAALDFFGNPIKGITLTETVQNLAFDGTTKLFKAALFKCKQCLEANKTMDTGKKDISQLGQFLKYGESENRHTSYWSESKHNKSTHCNELRGTDGTQFHPNVKESDTLVVYESMLCRTIKFKKGLTNQSPHGIDTLRFYAIEDNFAKSTENECFCYEDNVEDCPAGLLNLKNCPPADAAHVSILASNPYFQSNPSLLKDSGIESLVKKEDLTLENYGTILDVEPYTGLALGAKKRVQLNALIKKGVHPVTKDLDKPRIIAPIMWLEESGDVDQKNADELKSKVFAPKRTFTGILIAVMVLGVVLVAVAGGCVFFRR